MNTDPWKEKAFKVLQKTIKCEKSSNFPGGTEKNHNKPQSGQQI